MYSYEHILIIRQLNEVVRFPQQSRVDRRAQHSAVRDQPAPERRRGGHRHPAEEQRRATDELESVPRGR